MTVAVWVDSWQQQCCGEPFRVGGQLSWTVDHAQRRWFTDHFGENLASQIDYAEEHHDGPTVRVLEGTVRNIRAVYRVYERVEPDGPLSRSVAGSTRTREVARSDAVPARLDTADFAGYLVTIDES